MKKVRTLLVVLLALILLGAATVSASSSQGPVVPPNATVQHKTYGDWLARYFQWNFAIPFSQNPGFGSVDACIMQKDGDVYMTTFSPAAGKPLDCGEVPRKAFLFMIAPVSLECSQVEAYPFHGDDEAGLIDCAHQYVFSGLSVALDGVPVPLEDNIVTSPMYVLRYTDDNALGVPGSGKTMSVAYGPSLMFMPMAPGKHTIELHGRLDGPAGVTLQGDAVIQVTMK